MKKALFWIKDHWYLPLFAAGLFLGWWLTRKGSTKGPPLAEIQKELKAIDAGREAREMKARLGATQAAEEVRRQHAEAIQRLDTDQAKKAEQLREDPVALSKFLVKAGRSR